MPGSIIGGHGVGDRDELSHGSDDGDFGWFALFTQAFVEGSNGWVVADGDSGRHIEIAPHRHPPACNVLLTARHAAIAVHGCDTSERGNLFVAREPEFGKLGDQRGSGNRSNAGDSAQKYGTTGKRGIGFDGVGDYLVEGGNFRGQKG